MHTVCSFVFFDIETTGLPWQEKNRTKITELSLVAASREDILITPHGDSPPVSKLTLVFNPCKTIHPEAVKMTGLSNDLLKNAPLFQQKVETILSFLQDLPKPICLVAHNGDRFDYKILLAEFNDAKVSLPNDLLCIDSLTGFKSILKDQHFTTKPAVPQPDASVPQSLEPDVTFDIITDDEDEWPDLNASTQDWEDIDEICNSLTDISCDEISEEPIKVPKPKKTKRSDTINQVFNKEKSHRRSEVICNVFKKKKSEPNPSGFTLVSLYRRLLGKKENNSHRAEDDCLMLLECVVATKDLFIPWGDSACKKLADIKPLIRY